MTHAGVDGRPMGCPGRDNSLVSQLRLRLRESRKELAAQRRALAEQRRTAVELQRAILPNPSAASEVNGVRVAVRCQGADPTAYVGGDWYLSDPLPGGEVLLAVGDVTGHGLAATATMVRLRHTMAALAAAGHGPGQILSALNRLLYQQAVDVAATAIIARYRSGTRTLTWSGAGHLPILLAHGDRIDPLWPPAGVLLGAVPEARYADSTRQLDPGDLLLMYTDGFVEERGGTIEAGVRALGEQARRAMGTAPADRSAAVVESLRRRNPSDDACALAAGPLR